MEIDFRYSEMDDMKLLTQWLSDKKVSFWYPPSSENEIRVFVSNWAALSKYRASLTALIDGKVCAIGALFLMVYKKVAHQSMFYFIMDPKQDNEEIERAVLKNILNLAEKYFKLEAIFIEVFEGFRAIALLEEFGFEKMAIQKNYVKENGKYLSRIIYKYFFKKGN